MLHPPLDLSSFYRVQRHRSDRLSWSLKFKSLLVTTSLTLCIACDGSEMNFEELAQQRTSRVTIPSFQVEGPDGRTTTLQRPHLKDAQDRYIHIRGINVSGSHKAPNSEEFPSLYPIPDDVEEECKSSFPWLTSEQLGECIPSRDISYLERPFPLDEADRWFGQLSGLGFNTVRLITNWESIQPYRPGSTRCKAPDYDPETCFDLNYLNYYEALIKKAKDYGIYVLLDMHQDMFSRHLMSYYNENPTTRDENGDSQPTTEGSLEGYLFSLLPPYTDWARGHGAPRWVVETCLPEKDLDAPSWGIFRSIGALFSETGQLNIEAVLSVQSLFDQINPGGEIPSWLAEFVEKLPKLSFKPNETSDFLPLTPWVVAGVLSLDVDRCFAALFAGDLAFPNLRVDGDGVTRRVADLTDPANALTLKEALQGHYESIWRELARRAAPYDNVIGYDIINEPVGAFIMLALSALQARGLGAQIEPLLNDLLGEMGADIFNVVGGLNLLPTYELEDCTREGITEEEAESCLDQNEAEKRSVNELWGMLDEIDLGIAIDLNIAFDDDYLQPFYERMGQAIQEEDPNAIIWFESSTSLRTFTGPMTFWDQPLTRPQGIKQLVFAPHWYPDIYPRPGVGSPPRQFNSDEWLYRDFTEPLHEEMEKAPTWLGNIPTIFGEFGTYFNFNGIDRSIESDYEISAHVLNSYYEAFESLGVGSILWCFSAENDRDYGEHWNHEDFSIIDPQGEARAWTAYVRPYARSLSGKLIHQRFYSPFHFWDPIEGVAPPERRFELEMELKGGDAPTEVFIPRRQYPEGFYIWLSDGQAYYDEGRQILYWYPHAESVGTQHRLMVQPALTDREYHGWRYYYSGSPIDAGESPQEKIGGRWLVGRGDTSTTYAEEIWPW